MEVVSRKAPRVVMDGPRPLHRGAILLCALLLSTWAISQGRRATDANGHLWISLWGDHRMSKHWSIHTEGHWRRADLGRNWQQLLLRPALNYHLNDQVMFTAGYSYYRNYSYGAYPIPFANWEHNAYQQVQLTGPIGRLSIAHRFRLEQRFLAKITQSASDPYRTELDSYIHQNRLRYRVGLTLPLGDHERVEPGVFSANLYDEVFLNFGDGQRLDYIQQNRISALLGYQVSRPMNLMMGYLLQTIQRPGAAEGSDLLEMNSTIHLVLVCNLDLRKKNTPE